MKIGIFGDSFAEATNQTRMLSPHAWYNIFSSKFSNLTRLHVHGVSASSVFYSYKKFLDLYQNYDLIIFCVTSSERYPKPLRLSKGQTHHFCGLGAIENVRRILGEKITKEDERTLEHLTGYFIMNVEEYNILAADLMLKDMSLLHPNVIFYPCFSDSFSKERQEKENIPQKYQLYEMYRKQLELLDINENIEKKELDTIVGHLVHEYNLFFANLLYKKVISGKWDFTGYDDIKCIEKPKEYYYEF
jgi:hypothetical protein